MNNDQRDPQSQLNQEPKPSSTTFVLSAGQSMRMTVCTIVGVGIMTLPRTATEEAHQAGWIMTMLVGILAFLIMWMITKLGLRFPGQTFVEYSEEVLGTRYVRFIGKMGAILISFIFIVVWLGLVVMGVREFAEVIEAAALPETPIEVIVGTMLITMMLFLLVELEVVGRFNDVMFVLLIIPLIIPVTIIGFIAFQGVSWTNIFPIFSVDFSSYVKDLPKHMLAYQGFTIMLLFMAFTQKGANTKAAIGGIAIPTFDYVLIIFASVAVFGYEELQELTWPVLELTKSTQLSFFVFDRIESAFLAMWIFAVFTTVGNLFYAACFAIAQMLPTPKENAARKWIALCLLPIMYWLIMWPPNIFEVFRWSTYISYSGFVLIALIILLFVVAILRRKGERRSDYDESSQP